MLEGVRKVIELVAELDVDDRSSEKTVYALLSVMERVAERDGSSWSSADNSVTDLLRRGFMDAIHRRTYNLYREASLWNG